MGSADQPLRYSRYQLRPPGRFMRLWKGAQGTTYRDSTLLCDLIFPSYSLTLIPMLFIQVFHSYYIILYQPYHSRK